MDIERQIADKIFRVATDAANSKPIDEEKIAHEIKHLATSQLQITMNALHTTNTQYADQIKQLAEFLMHECPEAWPSDGSEGAIDMAIRLIREQQQHIHHLLVTVRAANDYYFAVRSANDTMRVNARRGGSSSAYEAVNRTRARAKAKHDALIEVCKANEQGTEYQEPDPAPTGERPEDV